MLESLPWRVNKVSSSWNAVFAMRKRITDSNVDLDELRVGMAPCLRFREWRGRNLRFDWLVCNIQGTFSRICYLTPVMLVRLSRSTVAVYLVLDNPARSMNDPVDAEVHDSGRPILP